MAKKKSVEDLVAEDDYAEKLTREIENDFGKGIFKKADEVLSDNRMVIPFSPAIDLGLGGGIVEGSFVILSGAPKLGKTSSMLQLCANAQKPEYGGRHIYYGNCENRLKKLNVEGIKGLDPNKMTVISSSEEKVLSAEEFLNIFIKVLNTHPGCVLAIDSYSALLHSKELTEGVGTSTRGGPAVLLAQFCRHASQLVPGKRQIVIGTQHVIANPGYGSPTYESGGNKIWYSCDTKLRGKKSEPWLVGNNPKPVGAVITWKMEASALPSPPQEIKSYFRFNKGLDYEMEAMSIGVDIGLITGSSWLTCEFMKDHLHLLDSTEWDEETQKKAKFHGSEKLRVHLESNPEWYEALMKSIKEMIG